ncbi:response regulator [Enterovibrio sp. NIFS-20-8]|nr:response regulator [Enterovibrio paralichthyis]
MRAVHTMPKLKDIPVIMLTSHSDKEIFRTCISNGANDSIVKPTQADVISKKVAKIVKQAS